MFVLIIFILILKFIVCEIYIDYDSTYIHPDGSIKFPFQNLSNALQSQSLLNLTFILQINENTYDFFDIYPENLIIYITSFS